MGDLPVLFLLMHFLGFYEGGKIELL